MLRLLDEGLEVELEVEFGLLSLSLLIFPRGGLPDPGSIPWLEDTGTVTGTVTSAGTVTGTGTGEVCLESVVALALTLALEDMCGDVSLASEKKCVGNRGELF